MTKTSVPILEIVGACGVALICLVTSMMMWPNQFAKIDAQWFQAIFTVIGIFAAIGIGWWQSYVSRRIASDQVAESRNIAAAQHQENKRIEEERRAQSDVRQLEAIMAVMGQIHILLTHTLAWWRINDYAILNPINILAIRESRTALMSFPIRDIPNRDVLIRIVTINARLLTFCEVLERMAINVSESEATLTFDQTDESIRRIEDIILFCDEALDEAAMANLIMMKRHNIERNNVS